MAIDRDAIVSTSSAVSRPGPTRLIPPTSWAFDRSGQRQVPFDTTRAAKALSTAGWKQAARVAGSRRVPPSRLRSSCSARRRRRTPSPMPWRRRRDGLAIASGSTCALRPARRGPRRPASPDRRLRSRGDRDHDRTGSRTSYPLLASTQATIGGSNFSGLQDAGLDALLVKARAPGHRRGAEGRLRRTPGAAPRRARTRSRWPFRTMSSWSGTRSDGPRSAARRGPWGPILGCANMAPRRRPVNSSIRFAGSTPRWRNWQTR